MLTVSGGPRLILLEMYLMVGISLMGESKEEEPTSVLNLESPNGNSKFYIKKNVLVCLDRLEHTNWYRWGGGNKLLFVSLNYIKIACCEKQSKRSHINHMHKHNRPDDNLVKYIYGLNRFFKSELNHG